MSGPRQLSHQKESRLTQEEDSSASRDSLLGRSESFESNLQQETTRNQVSHHRRPSQLQHGAKIAIPRLRREPDNISPAVPTYLGDKHRVSHACEPCRYRKTKCSGERPQCKHCQDFKIPCVYADRKRTRIDKDFRKLVAKLDEHEKLLRDLSARVDKPDQIRIQKALDHDLTGDDETAFVSDSRRTIRYGRARNNDEVGGENFVSARVGSPGSIDHIDEDFNESAATRATGFMGRNSELTWIQRLKQQTANDNNQVDGDASQSALTNMDMPHIFRASGEPGPAPISESTYHCDDLAVLISDEIDKYEFPPTETAICLFQHYMDSVHPTFPILGKTIFTDQFHQLMERKSVYPGDKLLAIVNLVFAIGAKYSHLVQAKGRGDERDHLIYFTRARKLGFDDHSILGHADLQRVQITGLIAFYFTTMNQINRAWNMSGIAIRFACSLGLNMRNESRNMSDSVKEIRYRIWWALCSVERLLTIMTGRSTCLLDADCTIPLPVPVDEELFVNPTNPDLNSPALEKFRSHSVKEFQLTDDAPSTTSSGHSTRLIMNPSEQFSPPSLQSNDKLDKNVPPSNALYFSYSTKLSILTSEVLQNLYRANVLSRSWSQVQTTISQLEVELEKWRQALAPVFDFAKKPRDQQFKRHRITLGFSYYSTLMIITRPCLCRVDRKIPDESSKAKALNCAIAAKCVHAAIDMLSMMPDEPNSIGFYKVAPWWCIVHHLVQATSILMLELSFRADHLPHEVDVILRSAKKAVCWLRSMAEEDLAAYRAWKLCEGMLRKVALKIGRRVDDLPSIPLVPSHHNAGNLPSLSKFPGNRDLNLDGGLSEHFTANMDYQSQSSQNFLPEPSLYSSYDDYLSNSVAVADLLQFNTEFSVASEMNTLNSASLEANEPFSHSYPEWNMDQGSS